MTDDMEERAIGLLKLENRDIQLQELKTRFARRPTRTSTSSNASTSCISR